MHRLIEKLTISKLADTTLTLPLAQRVKSRLRVTLDNGEAAGLFLPRGSNLRDGDLLRSEDGFIVQIRAATELLSCVESADRLLLARACYHLGNRHIALQIEAGRLCYLHDHVLDELVRGLGLSVHQHSAPFEPELGAYNSSHSHAQHSH
jgi:urease accessory protein